jgi:hypothetical protein
MEVSIETELLNFITFFVNHPMILCTCMDPSAMVSFVQVTAAGIIIATMRGDPNAILNKKSGLMLIHYTKSSRAEGLKCWKHRLLCRKTTRPK